MVAGRDGKALLDMSTSKVVDRPTSMSAIMLVDVPALVASDSTSAALRLVIGVSRTVVAHLSWNGHHSRDPLC